MTEPNSRPNISSPVFDEPREQPGFRCSRARVSRQAGSERLGLSLWEVPPGEAAYPYHHHLGEEELIVVLQGSPSMRTPDGWQDLQEGDVVAFLRGEEGAHQLVNRRRRAAHNVSPRGYRRLPLRRARPRSVAATCRAVRATGGFSDGPEGVVDPGSYRDGRAHCRLSLRFRETVATRGLTPLNLRRGA
jgi:uncharacterized cupin superfamily protein